jgi:ADP-ribose pyrophosphatase
MMWERIKPTIVSKIGYRVIISKMFRLPSGIVGNFETVNAEHWQGVSVIAITDDNKIIIVRQFRPGPEKIMDELPSGFVDDGEDAASAASRELLEEAGYEAGTMTFLGTMYYDAYTNGRRQCFLATGCKLSEHGALPGEHEFIEIDLISVDQLLDNARSGKMTDPGTVLLAYDELQKRR